MNYASKPSIIIAKSLGNGNVVAKALCYGINPNPFRNELISKQSTDLSDIPI